jgi:hypothetical protein
MYAGLPSSGRKVRRRKSKPKKETKRVMIGVHERLMRNGRCTETLGIKASNSAGK